MEYATAKCERYVDTGHAFPMSTAPVWKKKNPKKHSTKLTDAEIARARARADEAGRRYPNLVDNMAILRERKTSAS